MRAGLAFALLMLPVGLRAQLVVTSPGPEKVAVSIYRGDSSSDGQGFELDDLQGYALVTETRTVQVPAGAVSIRFEGVAGGIIPVSAIVTGLPGGVIQKNRDARLLSPAALVDGSYGKRLHLRRTDRKTGKVTEQDAELVSGPQGGVIIRTPQGLEALGCAGLSEGLRYDGVPEGLTAKPTLSVDTVSPVASTAVVQLSYLASNFDWAANYVIRVSKNREKLDLFAWLTLANGNAETLRDASTDAIAGSINREDDPEDVADSATGGPLALKCWPMDITSTHPRWDRTRLPPPPPDALAEDEGGGEEIIVTARRRSETLMDVPVAVTALMAEQLELGDLKLYRIPEPVTVAANAQKQVALLQKDNVPFELLYTPRDAMDEPFSQSPMQRSIRMENKADKGLGLPLPAGDIALFEPHDGQWLLVSNEGRLFDTPIGQKVEIDIGESDQVQAELKLLEEIERRERPPRKQIVVDEDGESSEEEVDDRYQYGSLGKYELTLTNANDFAVRAWVPIAYHRGSKPVKFSAKLTPEPYPTWKVTIPANGSAKLRYTLKQD